MNILGLIPARGGSKEVPRKNLLKIDGKTLIQLAIESGNESQYVDKVVLSSDDDEIIEEARKFSCLIPFKRPASLGTDTSSTFSVIRHAVDWFDNQENWSIDIIVLLQPTTPFRRGHHIDKVVKRLLESDADAVITVREPDYTPYWMLEMGDKNILKNIIKDGNQYKRRQDAPKTYQPAGMVYAFKKKILYEMDTLFPYKDTRGVVISKEESINIDSQIDYETALAVQKLLKG